ncbi:hypothetical protein V6Z12_D11G075200 [Gossypium hirsutum]
MWFLMLEFRALHALKEHRFIIYFKRIQRS